MKDLELVFDDGRYSTVVVDDKEARTIVATWTHAVNEKVAHVANFKQGDGSSLHVLLTTVRRIHVAESAND